MLIERLFNIKERDEEDDQLESKIKKPELDNRVYISNHDCGSNGVSVFKFLWNHRFSNH
jgi:hypothetical protein